MGDEVVLVEMDERSVRRLLLVVLPADVVTREGLTVEEVMLEGVTEFVLLIAGDELVADVMVLLLEFVELNDAVVLLIVRVESALNNEPDDELVS